MRGTFRAHYELEPDSLFYSSHNMPRRLETWSDIARVEHKKQKLIILAIGAAIVLLGLWFFYDEITDRCEARDARENWVRIPCELQSVDVENVTNWRLHKGGHHRPRQASNSEIIISYRYTYDGCDYQGERYSVPDETGMSEVFRKKSDAIRSKQNHFCYVNPANPQESAYTILPNRESWGDWYYAVAFGLLGLVWTSVYLWRLHKERAATS